MIKRWFPLGDSSLSQHKVSSVSKPGEKLELTRVETSMGFLLRRVAQHFKEATVPILKYNGLSILELTTLNLIYANKACILRTLAEAVGVEPPAMNRIINSLESKQLVSRLKDSQDARYTYFQLTEEGTACMRKATPEVRAAENEALKSLTEDERDALFRSLRKFL